MAGTGRRGFLGSLAAIVTGGAAPRPASPAPEPIPRVQAGQVMTAATMNALIDRVNALDAERKKGAGRW